MGVRHSKVLTQADATDTTLVGSSEWNDHHLMPVYSFELSSGNVTWINQPAAETEFLGQIRNRTKIDLTGAAEIRLAVNVGTAGTSGSELRLQYSTDQGTWAYPDGVDGPKVALSPDGRKTTAWIALPDALKADVFYRFVGINGDGTADPGFGPIVLQVR